LSEYYQRDRRGKKQQDEGDKDTRDNDTKKASNPQEGNLIDDV